jgi:hypothetical protein
MSESLLSPADLPDASATPCPADVPAKFWDAASGTLRTEALLKSYGELERRLSQKLVPPAADAPPDEVVRFRDAMGIPAAAEDYCIEPSCEHCCADAEVNAQLHAAHFSQPQAQLVYDLAGQKLMPLIAEAAAHYEADRQREKLALHYGSTERFAQVATQLAAWGRANLPPAVYQALSSTAEGVLALEQMMRRPEPTLGRDVSAPTPTTEAELRAMMRDPRYWRAREPAFVQRVTEGFRKLVGATPA